MRVQTVDVHGIFDPFGRKMCQKKLEINKVLNWVVTYLKISLAYVVDKIKPIKNQRLADMPVPSTRKNRSDPQSLLESSGIENQGDPSFIQNVMGS